MGAWIVQIDTLCTVFPGVSQRLFLNFSTAFCERIPPQWAHTDMCVNQSFVQGNVMLI